jgi:hypothetical protein
MYTAASDFPKGITVLDAITAVYDDKMKEISNENGLYNHHNVFFDLAGRFAPPITCGPSLLDMFNLKAPFNIFMGGAADTTSNHYTSPDGRFNSGYYISNESDILQMIDIINYNPEPRTVFTVSEMEYVDGKPTNLLAANAIPINLGMCDGAAAKKTIMEPMAKGQTADGKRRFTLTGKDITIARDGYFLNWHGHMHDGGDSMSAKINGKEICTSKALYGGPGHEGKTPSGGNWTMIREMEFCETNQPIKVSKGDKLTIAGNFDLEKHPLYVFRASM